MYRDGKGVPKITRKWSSGSESLPNKGCRCSRWPWKPSPTDRGAKDYKEAVKWYTKSAEQGDAESHTTWDDVQQRRRSAPRLQGSGQVVHQVGRAGDADAQLHLGNMYYNGEGVPEDNREAVVVHKAAEQGHAEAQRMVGVCYAYGLGVAKNPIEGYAWYNIAIANGNEDAKENIKEIELSPEQLIEAQSLSTEIYKRIEANQQD